MSRRDMLGVALCDVRGPLNDLFEKLSGENGQNWLAELKKFLRMEDLPDLNWFKVYQTLGMEKEYPEFAKANEGQLSPHPGLWTIPVLKGVTPNKIMEAFRKLEVATYQYADDMDKEVTKNDRDPNRNGSYTVSFKKTVEADPDQKNKSADMLAGEGVKGITLLERLLLELGYFLATNKHLDVENITLCLGSRYSDGRVPAVNWYTDSRRLYVYWDGTDDRCDNLRARAAVS